MHNVMFFADVFPRDDFAEQSERRRLDHVYLDRRTREARIAVEDDDVIGARPAGKLDRTAVVALPCILADRELYSRNNFCPGRVTSAVQSGGLADVSSCVEQCEVSSERDRA